MKAEDLQLGNWVRHDLDGSFQRVKILREQVINGYAEELFSPVTLTEEILKESGFEIDSIGLADELGYVYTDRYLRVRIAFTDQRNGFLLQNPDFSRNVRYVHDLQNLFRAMAEEHLKIEL